MLERLAVRWAVAYLFLYWFPTPLDYLPFIGQPIANAATAVWRPVIELTGKILSLEVPPPQVTGSGDTLADWLRLGATMVLALVVGALWSLDKRKTRDEAVLDFSRDYLRLCLAATMIGYGVVKVLLQQFPQLDDYTLYETYADSSPMGLLWRFMGFSPAYQRLAGLLELLGGLLLLTRRTTTAGAVILAIVMSNVVLLNFCFDVPVKLYSTNILFGAIALLMSDADRLLSLFVTHRPLPPKDFTPKYATGRWRLVMPAVSIAFAGVLLHGALMMEDAHEPQASADPLEGSYAVIRQSGGVVWHAVQFSSGRIALKRGAEDWQYKSMSVDDHTLKFENQTLVWSERDGHKVLTGTWDNEPIEVSLRKLEPAKQPLLTRGFHWVNERPFNR